MPRSNLTGGKHHKKGKKKRPDNNPVSDNRVELAGESQVYALVKAKCGGNRLNVECSDGKVRSASIPGKFFKKVWMNAGDIILCDLNIGSDDSLCYIVHKYTSKDASMLKSQGKITFEVLEDKEENNSFKFVEKNTVPAQKRNLDLDNIDDSLESSVDDNDVKDDVKDDVKNDDNDDDNDNNNNNDNDNDDDDDNVDLDDL